MTRSLLLVLALVLVACGDDSTSATGPEAVPGLSASFTRNCARCHGARGQGQTVDGRVYPAIPNGQDEGAFIALVRGGRGSDMPAFDESQFSDADLKSDYAWLAAERSRN